LIDDADYDPLLESRTVSQLIAARKIPATRTQIRFLVDMQQIHDFKPVKEWKVALKNYSKQNGLKFNW